MAKTFQDTWDLLERQCKNVADPSRNPAYFVAGACTLALCSTLVGCTAILAEAITAHARVKP